MTKVWNDIAGIWGLAKIQRGIRKKAKFLDGIRDLIATSEAGFAKNLARDAVLGKGNDIRGRDCRSSGSGGIVVKKKRE